jgi:hypothetical protein
MDGPNLDPIRLTSFYGMAPGLYRVLYIVWME